MASGNQSWFQGYVAWYLRAALWFVQSTVATVIALAIFGTEGQLGIVGVGLSGFLAALFLFRQVDKHVQQELGT